MQARRNNGYWHLRIDDLDTLRIIRHATDDILRTLEALGLTWDGSILFQSHRLKAYESAIDELEKQDLLYACTCSRNWLKQNTKKGPNGSIYPGICRNKKNPRARQHALRIRTCGTRIAFEDRLQGSINLHLDHEDGDFIIRRRDGIIAYQLAAAIDEYQQQITEVVRGTDLLSSTPRQIYLQQILNISSPRYCHIPVLVDEFGVKLSKQTGATPITTLEPSKVVNKVLTLLKHPPPKDLTRAPAADLLDWAIANWNLTKLNQIESITSTG